MGKDNQQVINLKEYYHLLEIRHWLFLKKAKETCNSDNELILFFYSNKGDCSMCEEQGNVLTYMHSKYPEISIYSFDANIENPAIQTMRSLYGASELPVLVVN
jgi:hypothetical protein